MKENTHTFGHVSRRKFLGTAATAAAAFSFLPLSSSYTSATSSSVVGVKPKSKFGGVQIGANTYSFRNMEPGILIIHKACVESGINSIDLGSAGVGYCESYLGAPAAPSRPQLPALPPGTVPAVAPIGGGGRRMPLTPEQQAAQDKYTADLKAWRLSVPMTKYEELRKLFNDAGMDIHMAKFSPSRLSDEEIDYSFRAAKALGAKGISEEIGEEAVKKLAPFAEKNGMYAIFHTHGQFGTPGFSYDPFLAVSPAVMLNFDVGHYYGSTGLHPNTIIDKYHDRIFSIHLKDKTGPKTTPPDTNQVMGQGETPIADILNLIKDKKWSIYCDIELEYPIAQWSTSVKELSTCVQYARNILI